MRFSTAFGLLVSGAAACGTVVLATHSPTSAATVSPVARGEPTETPVELVQLLGTEDLRRDAASAEIALTLQPDDRLTTLLERAGVDRGDARQAERIVRSRMPDGIPETTEIAILLGSVKIQGSYPLEALRLQTPARLQLFLHRDSRGALRVGDVEVAPDTKLQRYTGEIGPSAYWSLRQAGVPAEASDEFVRTLAGQMRPGRFEAVVATGHRANGAQAAPALLYAAVHRPGRPAIRRVKWTVGTQTRWLDPAAPVAEPPPLATPVHGRITSQFGGRAHPIIRLFRFHKGVDIAARKGTPIRAAADGRVIAEGWNGGHGQQVRLAHAEGLETSYSHMSSIAASAGSWVRQGQVIGYVGSTGLSTGPHLHFEVRRGGSLVDPLSMNLAGPRQLDVEQRAEIARHVRQLLTRAKLNRA